jgi:hypothetical protein
VGALPQVRLELGHGTGRTTVYDLSEAAFLIGSVPGCDARLPGANVPPVVCLIVRQPRGVLLRKLAPVYPVQLNGATVTTAPLADGNRVSIGPLELRVQVTAAPAVTAGPTEPGPAADGTAQDLDARRKQLEAQTQDLEADRVLWYRRRQEIEQECGQLREAAAAVRRHLAQMQAQATEDEQAGEPAQDELLRQRAELEARAGDLTRQQEQLDVVRGDLAAIRQQLYRRYRARRERCDRMREAVRTAGRKLRDRQRELEDKARQPRELTPEEIARQNELETRAAELDQRQRLLEEQRGLAEERQRELQEEIAGRLRECQARERQLAEERQTLEKLQAQYQADLVRLDRLQAVLEQRQQQLRARALEVDRRGEQQQRTSRELEEHATDLDEWHSRLTAEAERFEARKAELDTAAAEAARRTATLEGQQSMLATLRTRLERSREELRREEQQLTEQRGQVGAEEVEARQRLQEAEHLRADLDREKQLHEEERQRLEERRGVLEAAVAQMRQAHETLAAEQEQLRQQAAALDAEAAKQAEQAALVRGRAEQLRQLQQRLEANRQALAKREGDLVRAEQALADLQEQLRRRSEEINARQKAVAEHARQQGEETAALEARLAEAQREQLEREERLAAQTRELADRTEHLEGQLARLDGRGRELEEREEALRQWIARLKETRQQQREETGRLAQARADLEGLRAEAAGLQRQLPELELRAQAGIDRLSRAREQLRGHLTEVHAYAQQSRDDLEALRAQVQAEGERIRQEELALHRERDEHRLAVAAFRQQLSDWQGQVAELKRSLAQGATRLERRQAEVEEQVRQVDATTARLAREAEQLQAKQRRVAERHDEVQRHLADMREWYRRKLRELAASQAGEVVEGADPGAEEPGPALPQAGPEPAGESGILALTGEVEPGDRRLGDLLQSLELVEADTLTALLTEARRRRRSLRQLLLSGGYLTLYQMALIEAGNVDGLVLGPVRVVDRLRSTPHEVVYRVFDPRRGHEAVLRHLTEVEGEDAVRPDEFRQRFAAAVAVRHPHVAATLEVLDIAGRPAVLQEWLDGLPSTEWPALASVPGVWFRLICQAALGVQTIHQAGLVHGHLSAERTVLTAEGILKVCGLGEPAWLAGAEAPEAQDAPGDLAALGRLAAGWLQPPIDAAPGAARRKAARTKPLPEALQRVLHRLQADSAEERYPSAAVVLEELDHAGADVPPNAAAWERLLRYVRDQAGSVGLRLSA